MNLNRKERAESPISYIAPSKRSDTLGLYIGGKGTPCKGQKPYIVATVINAFALGVCAT